MVLILIIPLGVFDVHNKVAAIKTWQTVLQKHWRYGV